MKPRKDLTYKTIRYFSRKAWKHPKYIIGLAIALPITVLLNSVLPPIILANVLNRLSTHDFIPHKVMASFGPELIIYALLVVAGGAGGWRIVDWLDWRLEGYVERGIAREVFDHLQKQSSTFHANHFGGSLVSQTNKLMGSYIRFADTTVFNVLPLLWSLLFMSLILASHSVIYGAIIIIFAALYIASTFYVTRPVRKLGAEQAARESAQTGVLADSITNVMAIKSFTGADYENKRFARATAHTQAGLFAMLRDHQRQQAYFSSMISLISGGTLVMAVIGVVVYGVNIATVFLILTYTASIVSQLFQFSNNALRNYNRALGDASDMVAILAMTPEILDPTDPEKPKISRGTIELNNICFTHDEADKALFDKLSLRIKAGEKVGLVGHSGSGKTTLTKLLLRFNDIDDGEILIDGQNITHLKQDDLRSFIAYVPQEPILFHRSLAENISYGNPSATQQEIEAIAKLAHAHDFICELPKGYETLVGERGVKLSGGQRQRVVIARAMLKNAPILVLDEATSALDSESEILIQSALWKLMERRTAIVVAHRLSTIQKMDRIIVLAEGKLIEQGSHKELLNAKGDYAKLWSHQSGGFIED